MIKVEKIDPKSGLVFETVEFVNGAKVTHKLSDDSDAVKTLKAMHDVAHDMWALLCNVNGGIVEKERPEWYSAFLRVRERYFPLMRRGTAHLEE